MLFCMVGPVGEEIPQKYPPLYCELTVEWEEEKNINFDIPVLGDYSHSNSN